MKTPPLILVSPNIEKKGDEFGDLSTSLSETYQQALNVALGGTLVADIPSLLPGALNHRRMDKRSQVVHEVRLTEPSLLAKIVRKPTLGVNSTHHQAVAKVAGPLTASAVSQDGIV